MTRDSISQQDGQGQQPVIGVVDVKFPNNKERIPWVIVSDGTCVKGNNLDKFVSEFARLATGRPALLGFEAPLFVPFGRQLEDICKARKCENPAWAAQAGAVTTAIALAVVPYTLQNLRKQSFDKVMTLDWRQSLDARSCLIFEAFVSGKGRVSSDSGKTAVCPVAERIAEVYPNLDSLNCIGENCIGEEQVFSAIGAALLRTGWTLDHSVLTRPCMVVKP